MNNAGHERSAVLRARRLCQEEYVAPSDSSLRREAVQGAAEQAANDAAKFERFVNQRMCDYPSEPRAMAEKMVAIALSEQSLANAARIREAQQLGSECDSMADWISVFEEPRHDGAQSSRDSQSNAFLTAQAQAIGQDTTPVAQATQVGQLPEETQSTQIPVTPRSGARLG